jgi:hypothetical protein
MDILAKSEKPPLVNAIALSMYVACIVRACGVPEEDWAIISAISTSEVYDVPAPKEMDMGKRADGLSN